MSLELMISDWISDYVKKNNIKSLVIGISGGIDSAVTSTLCAMTGFKTIVVTMPIHQKQIETDRGEEHSLWLKNNFSSIDIVNVNLTKVYDQLICTIPDRFNNPLALANTRARIRMSALYMIAGSSNGIVVGTGNKVEDFGVGFFTKYGDGGVDISPIAGLMKSEVYTLAEKLNINNEILIALPTDGLWEDGRTDEDQLGVTYDELEWAMHWEEKNNKSENLLSKTEKSVLSIYRMHRKQNLHKMKTIPTFNK
jgi:NAD+ synthase